MKNIFLLLFILCYTAKSNFLIAVENSKIIDSLLLEYAKFNNQNDLLKGEKLNLKIYKIAVEQNNKKAQIKALNNLSFSSIFKNDFLNGFNYSEQAINIAKEINNDTILVNLYLNKSKLFFKTDNIEGAIKYLTKARNIIIRLNDNASSKFYYNTLATFYYNQKEYIKGINNFKLALLKSVHLKDTLYYRSIFDNIGLCYRNMGNYNMAEYYFLKAIYFSKLYKSPIGLVNASINLSKNFLLNNQLDQAIATAQYAVKTIKLNTTPLNYPIEISLNLAKIYLKKKDYIRTDSVMNIINILLKNKKAIDEDIIEYLELTYKKHKALKSPKYITSFENYLKAKDSIQNLKKTKIENTLKDKFTIAEKLEDYETIEHNLILQEVENRWIMGFSIIIIFGIVILLYMFYKAKSNIKELKILQQEIKKQNNNLEIFNKQKDYILATVAHDLRGPIGNIN
ncbi:MAG: tetratricopeptide repeat protein, partial [Bacteroidia bacterium]|nr:tetratricopeptide repeat protein [Bacteroidia bacterium]